MYDGIKESTTRENGAKKKNIKNTCEIKINISEKCHEKRGEETIYNSGFLVQHIHIKILNPAARMLKQNIIEK